MGGLVLLGVVRYWLRSRSSRLAPHRAMEPCSCGVWMGMRVVSAQGVYRAVVAEGARVGRSWGEEGIPAAGGIPVGVPDGEVRVGFCCGGGGSGVKMMRMTIESSAARRNRNWSFMVFCCVLCVLGGGHRGIGCVVW